MNKSWIVRYAKETACAQTYSFHCMARYSYIQWLKSNRNYDDQRILEILLDSFLLNIGGAEQIKHSEIVFMALSRQLHQQLVFFHFSRNLSLHRALSQPRVRRTWESFSFSWDTTTNLAKCWSPQILAVQWTYVIIRFFLFYWNSDDGLKEKKCM